VSSLVEAQRVYQAELAAAGLLVPVGIPGVYGRGPVFEDIAARFERYVTRVSNPAIHFPPLLGRPEYLKTDHLENFPDLMGSVHGFAGKDADHLELMHSKESGGDWAGRLSATDLMLCPAACYPLYPTARGRLPEGGRTVDLIGTVFRNEPSPDPARMRMFRQREVVRLGTAEEALAHRDHWLAEGERMLRSVGLDVRAVPANDPFFGRGGRMMVATQREQSLKYELVVPIVSAEKPTAVSSSNCHLDHFGVAFGIETADGKPAHSACVGFGLERIALALFKAHGFDPGRWPAEVREVLGLP
jgi:seryl-tRNA synthetase